MWAAKHLSSVCGSCETTVTQSFQGISKIQSNMILIDVTAVSLYCELLSCTLLHLYPVINH